MPYQLLKFNNTYIKKRISKMAMEENQEFSLSSNWNTVGDTNLCRVVFDTSLESKNISIDEVKIDNCVCLVNPDSDDGSKAFIHVKANGNLTSISIISEAQIIEVFGVNDEYLFTHTSIFIDDWEDMAVYTSTIVLPCIPVCKLKFSRAKYKNRVWIYGAKLTIDKNLKSPIKRINPFNIEQIKRLLGNPDLTDSSKQNNIRNFLKLYFSDAAINNLNYIIESTSERRNSKIYKCHNNSHNEQDVNNLTTNASKAFAKLYLNQDLDGSPKLCSNEVLSESSNSDHWLIAYIDRKFNDIKLEILHEMDVKLSILKEDSNLRLEKITTLLENLSTKM